MPSLVPEIIPKGFRAGRLHQRGASLLLLMVVTLIAVTAFFAADAFFGISHTSDNNRLTDDNLQYVRDALVAYVAANQRLPCPADGAASTGASVPQGPTLVCTILNGTVPWQDLGIAPDKALDGWGQKISYRVFQSLTNAGGASMTHCDTVPLGPIPSLPADGLCATTHGNTVGQFLVNKGFTVNDRGNAINQVAFVLISHGPTGRGAWLASGTRASSPAGGNAAETANLGSVGPFVVLAKSDAAIAPDDPAFFDDQLLWLQIADLARMAHQDGRDWHDADPPVVGTAATLTEQSLANLNQGGTNQFVATGGGTGNTFTGSQVAEPEIGASGVPILAFGGANSNTPFGGCIWWPNLFTLYNPSSNTTTPLRIYLEFALAPTARGDFGGFVVGLIPPKDYWGHTVTVSNTTCGDTSSIGSLAWDGNWTDLPVPRLGVEVDTHQDATYADVAPNHVALDNFSVTHLNPPNIYLAPVCNATADSYDVATGSSCYTGTNTAWLRNGLAVFHSLRVEVVPRDPGCPDPWFPSNRGPRFKTWIIPNSVCTDIANETFCNASKNMGAAFTPASIPTGVVALSTCAVLNSTTTMYDQLYFGLTASDSGSGNGSGVYIRNLFAATLAH